MPNNVNLKVELDHLPSKYYLKGKMGILKV